MSSNRPTVTISESLHVPGDAGLLLGTRSVIVAAVATPSVDLIGELVAEVRQLLPGGIDVVGVYNAGASKAIDKCLVATAADGKVRSIKVPEGEASVAFAAATVARCEVFVPRGISADALRSALVKVVSPVNCVVTTQCKTTIAVTASGGVALKAVVVAPSVSAASSAWDGVTLPVAVVLPSAASPIAGCAIAAAVEVGLRRAEDAAAASSGASTVDCIRVEVPPPLMALTFWAKTGSLPPVSEVRDTVRDLFGIAVKSSAVLHPAIARPTKKDRAAPATEVSPTASASPAAQPMAAKGVQEGGAFNGLLVGMIVIAAIVAWLAVTVVFS